MLTTSLRNCLLLTAALTIAFAQESPTPTNLKTWIIPSAQEHGVPAPPDAEATRRELAWLHMATAEPAPETAAQVRYWDSGPPSYRWMELAAKRQSEGLPIGTYFARTYAYLSMAIYDASLATAVAKETYKRPRPFEVDATLRQRVAMPRSFSYPSDYAATAAAAAAVMGYLIPAEAEHFRLLAEEAAKSRLYAGVEYPSDFHAGWELGLRVAGQVIEKARRDGSDVVPGMTPPAGRCMWTGTNPGNISGMQWKPLLLSSPAEFRPAPPPSCDSPQVMTQLAEVRNFPRALTTANLNTNARALYWQTPEGIFPWAFVQLNRWILEDKLERDPLRAARAYALLGAVGFDAFIASQDGKYAYWYARPAQLDPSITPLFPAPNFPSYPSNHSTFSTARAEVLAYLFPERAAAIRAMGKEAGDSRIWAGIHFEMDNQAGVELGHKVASKFIMWAEKDGFKQ